MQVDNDWNCKKKGKNKRVYALGGGRTMIGIAKKDKGKTADALLLF